MAVKEIKTRVKLVNVGSESISTNTTTVLGSVDTADYDLGVTFGLYAPAFNAGSFALTFEESDDDSTWSAVPADYLIGGAITVTAASAAGDDIASVGIISNKRYIRPSIVSTGASGSNTLNCVAELAGELKPVS